MLHAFDAHQELRKKGAGLIKHGDICNAALLNYTDDRSLAWRCHHEKAGNY